ncbi:MAG: CBS domain-containing protein [Burkholderiales bacterium]|nr:CBS domain-containing protein [Burkholderiales bacterium]
MSVGEVCNRTVIVTSRATRLDEAARLMREHHVGSVIVVDETAAGNKAAGIVTDRDIVIEAVASGVAPATVTVEEIMPPDLVVAKEGDDMLDTLTKMRAKGIRRVPVVDDAGTLVGILSLDDLLAILSEQVDGMVKVIAQEQAREARTRK